MTHPYRRVAALCAAFLFALLLGQVTDATTGQPLPGVRINVTGKLGRAAAVSDRAGRFRATVPAGRYTLSWESRDVPAARTTITIGARTTYTVRACSVTLDYNCGGNGPSPGAGGRR